MRKKEAAKEISGSDQVKRAKKVLDKTKQSRIGRQFKLVKVDSRTIKEVEVYE